LILLEAQRDSFLSKTNIDPETNGNEATRSSEEKGTEEV